MFSEKNVTTSSQEALCSKSTFRVRKLLAHTKHWCLALSMLVSAQALAQSTIDIPAQSLADALKELGAESGLQIIYASELVQGKSSRAARGTDPQAVLQQLLENTGIAYTLTADTATLYASNDNAVITLPAVQVGTDAATQNGSAEAGYVVREIRIAGPWKDRALQDTPYSMNVISSELLENSFVRGIEEVAKRSPTLELNRPSNEMDNQQANIRGFHLLNSTIIDGVNMSVGSQTAQAISFEEFEQIEVMGGVAGFMYGTGDVGGTINYVLKRPTDEPLRKVAVGNYGGKQYFGHVDLGGPIDREGKFGYRINVAHQDGETPVDGQNIHHELVSGALDWHVSNSLLLQIEGAYRKRQIDSQNALFYIEDIQRPKAYDNSKSYTADWTQQGSQSHRIGLNATLNINETFDLRMAYKYREVDNLSLINYYPMLIAEDTFVVAGPYFWEPNSGETQGGYAYLDANFDTGSISHKLTVGVSGSLYEYERYQNNLNVLIDISKTYTLDELDNLPMVSLPPIERGELYRANRATSSNVIIGDDITLNEHWSALIGANYSTLSSTEYDTNAIETSKYDKSELTPTLSLIYKPFEELSSYGTYMEALEPGTIVPDDGRFTNAGEVLPPLVSKQYELGAKYSPNPNILISSALFRIEKPNQYSNNAVPATYVQDGLQVHQGIELSVTGKVTPNLTLIAGGTVMDLSVEESNNPALVGKKPTNVSSRMAKLYAEYRIPGLEGLSVTGGAYYTGEKYGDILNIDTIPSYKTYDLGLRYETNLGNFPAVFNLNATNLTDEDYWVGAYNIGMPRTVAFSMQTRF